jgi:hypothetical protein
MCSKWAVCLGIKHPPGAYDQISITVRQLRFCWCGAHSLTSGRVCRLQLLLGLASAVIFGSECHGTRDHILLSQIGDFPFRRLLRREGLWWRYSYQRPHRISSRWSQIQSYVRLTVSRPVCLGVKHPSGAYDQLFITVWRLQTCWCGALSLTRGRVCYMPESQQ